jgi:hypothetical protein
VCVPAAHVFLFLEKNTLGLSHACAARCPYDWLAGSPYTCMTSLHDTQGEGGGALHTEAQRLSTVRISYEYIIYIERESDIYRNIL